MDPATPLFAALEYAKLGWRVLPCHSLIEGVCSCGKRDCRSRGKHPQTPNGVKGATDDPTVIEEWWGQRSTGNVGVATGVMSGIVVVDIDPRHGGDKSIEALIAEHGPLPVTVEAATGGGGTHLVFAHPGGVVGNRSGVLPGIDVRGDGGYILVAPSNHASGGSYRWLENRSPVDLKPAALPQWLHDLIVTKPAAVESNGDAKSFDWRSDAAVEDRARRYIAKIPGAVAGERGHDRTFRVACILVRGFALPSADSLALLREWNASCCPPWPEKDLQHKVADAARAEGELGYLRFAKPDRYDALVSAKHVAPTATVEGLEYQPFPVDALPNLLCEFITAGASAIGCDPVFIALPLLSAIAAAIGNTRRIELKPGWTESPIVWTGIVGESGTSKSPAFKLAVTPLRALQAKKLKEYADAFAAYEVANQRYEKELAAWKRASAGGEPPTKPVAPSAVRYVVGDATVEALAPILLENPRGVLLARDELNGWFNSFDKYTGRSKGGGSDESTWLSMHIGESIVVDRKTGTPKTIFVPWAAVSITGGIQPRVLARSIGREHRENGLLARMLLGMPPRRSKRWTDADISEEARSRPTGLLERLLDLNFILKDGEPHPIVLPLSPAAKMKWITFYNEHAEQQARLSGDLAAAWSKLEAYAARIALIIHLVRCVAGDPDVDPGQIDEKSIAAGITIVRWFGYETKRVYASLDEGDLRRDRRELVEYIRSHGGSITASELLRGSNRFRERYRTVDHAETALMALAADGYGPFELPPRDSTGAPRVRRFTLRDPENRTPAPTKVSESSEISTFVGVGAQ